jgi:sugar porter (SP) family MFS transporter
MFHLCSLQYIIISIRSSCAKIVTEKIHHVSLSVSSFMQAPAPPKQTRNKVAILSVGAVLFAPLLFGLMVGSTGPTIDTMKNAVLDYEGNVQKLPPDSRYVVMTAEQASWFGAIVTIGCMVGALGGGPVTEYLGLKKTILATIPLYATSWLLIGLLSQVWALILSRVVLGLAVGVNSFVAPTYIGEASPTHLRGLLGASNQLSITIGILLVYFLGLVCTVSGGTVYSGDSDIPLGPAPDGTFCNWRLLALLNLVPTGLLGIGTFFIPESPRWLAKKGRIAEAKACLHRLRGGQETAEEIEALEQQASIAAAIDFSGSTPQSTGLRDLWEAKYQISIGIALQVFQQCSGINAIMFYCTTIMRNARMENAGTISLTVMIEQVVVTALACYLMDKAGRRVLLLTGSSVMAVSCGLFGLFFALQARGTTGINWMVFVSVYVYMAAFSIGVGAIPWLIMAEIFPNKVRSLGSSVAVTVNWMFAFIITITLNTMTDKIQYYGVMWLFGGCSAGLAVFAFFFIPETKGKSFEEIQAWFANRKSTIKKSTTEEIPQPTRDPSTNVY